jgi:hypothetical protein
MISSMLRPSSRFSKMVATGRPGISYEDSNL